VKEVVVITTVGLPTVTSEVVVAVSSTVFVEVATLSIVLVVV
jgi:hypothetical protein